MEFTSIKIDLSYFYSLTNGDKAFEQKLLIRTTADVENLINNLKNAWEINDGEGVKKSAHSLISLTAVIGIPMAESWCRKMEHIFSDHESHPEYKALYENIISCWSCAFPQLQDIITTMLLEAQ